jgi:4-hydroxy-2-oxoglutarate aldolase
VKLYELSAAATKQPLQLVEAQELQAPIARADITIAKASVPGIKFLIERLYGYGGSPRKPLTPIGIEDARRLWEHPHVQELVKIERELSAQWLAAKLTGVA